MQFLKIVKGHWKYDNNYNHLQIDHISALQNPSGVICHQLNENI